MTLAARAEHTSQRERDERGRVRFRCILSRSELDQRSQREDGQERQLRGRALGQIDGQS